MSSGGKCPMSPNMRQETVPVGRMVRYVREQLKVHNLSHASGGSCSALDRDEKNYLNDNGSKFLKCEDPDEKYNTVLYLNTKRDAAPKLSNNNNNKKQTILIHLPTQKVTNDIGMAHDYFVFVFHFG